MDGVWERSQVDLSGRRRDIAYGAVRVTLAGGASPAPTSEKAAAQDPGLDELNHDWAAAALRRGRATNSPPQFGQTRLISSAQRGQNVHS